jgi:hypothetical protein
MDSRFVRSLRVSTVRQGHFGLEAQWETVAALLNGS